MEVTKRGQEGEDGERLDCRARLVLHNKGNRPTFNRNGAVSFIDLTLSTEDIANQISNWRVLDEENLSDHPYILFEVAEGDQGFLLYDTNDSVKGWKTNNLEGYLNRLGMEVAEWRSRGRPVTAEDLVTMTLKSCQKTLRKKSPRLS